jgi:polysaccharide export outer membrane protein
MIKNIIGVFAVIFIAACSSNDSSMMMPEDILDYSPEPYKIGVGDGLRVQVWGNERLSMESVPVRPDGKISMPLKRLTPTSALWMNLILPRSR